MKYICLGYYKPEKFAAMTKDEQHAMFDDCFEYDDHLRANGHFTGGEALPPPETALTLYWKNGKVATTDAPYAETKEELGGILVLEARDMNHAVQLMSQHPGHEIWVVIRDTSSRRFEGNNSRERAATAKGRRAMRAVPRIGNETLPFMNQFSLRTSARPAANAERAEERFEPFA
jgi:hypothetical protein